MFRRVPATGEGSMTLQSSLIKYAVLVLVALLSACATTRGGDDAAKDQVAAATRAWIDAMGSHEQERVLSLYDPGAVLWGTTSPTIRADPASIRQYFVFYALRLHTTKAFLVNNTSVCMVMWRSTAGHTPSSAQRLTPLGSRSAVQRDSPLCIGTATGAG